VIVVEQSVEFELAEETEVLRENLSQCRFITTNPTLSEPGSNPGRHGGKPANNQQPKLWHGPQGSKFILPLEYYVSEQLTSIQLPVFATTIRYNAMIASQVQYLFFLFLVGWD
jgi:hypothetical protein